jgi:hypothetical protein
MEGAGGIATIPLEVAKAAVEVAAPVAEAAVETVATVVSSAAEAVPVVVGGVTEVASGALVTGVEIITGATSGIANTAVEAASEVSSTGALVVGDAGTVVEGVAGSSGAPVENAGGVLENAEIVTPEPGFGEDMVDPVGVSTEVASGTPVDSIGEHPDSSMVETGGLTDNQGQERQVVIESPEAARITVIENQIAKLVSDNTAIRGAIPQFEEVNEVVRTLLEKMIVEEQDPAEKTVLERMRDKIKSVAVTILALGFSVAYDTGKELSKKS